MFIVPLTSIRCCLRSVNAISLPSYSGSIFSSTLLLTNRSYLARWDPASSWFNTSSDKYFATNASWRGRCPLTGWARRMSYSFIVQCRQKSHSRRCYFDLRWYSCCSRSNSRGPLRDLQSGFGNTCALPGTVQTSLFHANHALTLMIKPLPNAFELYGVDFLVSQIHTPSYNSNNTHAISRPSFQVQLLEINSEPAIELTGPRLNWILEDLFLSIGKVCVTPFFTKEQQQHEDVKISNWAVGETRHGLRKCLEVVVRGSTWQQKLVALSPRTAIIISGLVLACIPKSYPMS